MEFIMKHTTKIYINCPYSEKDECKRAPKDAQRRPATISPLGLRTYFGAGVPQGAPSRARCILDKSNKPSDYIKQLRNIDNTIKSAGLFHNDYRTKGPGHFFVKNNKIYLIDYDGLSKKKHLPRNDIEKIIKEL